MAIMKSVQPTKTFMGKLLHGADLLQEITDVCVKEDIRLGRVEAIGAVQKARFGFYNQEKHEYQFMIIDRPLEITKLIGNISIRDGIPMVHAHVTLADEEGRCYGGHLAPETIVFACELIVESFEGPSFVRTHDQVTGLPLWEMEY